MVGTPECNPFFEQAMQLARRSVGLQYQSMAYDAYFESFCKILFEHQYVKNRTEISSAIIEWLYEHSSGILSVVVSLIHDAQEIAILNGKEILDMEMLNQAYNQRLAFLHSYIQPSISQKKQTSRPKKKNPVSKIDSVQEKDNECVSISDLAVRAKAENLDMVAILREFYTVEEVMI